MLRITRVKGDDSVETLRLEGKLLGPWVAELMRACAQAPEPAGRLSLDLSAVTFVDEAGVKLLRDLRVQGITLAGSSGLVAELLNGDRH